MKTYLLYDTQDDWNDANQQAEQFLGIPSADGLTTEYDIIKQVTKVGHTDYGKYIFTLIDIEQNGVTLKSQFPEGRSLSELGTWQEPIEEF
jgi:hypothetical protein